MERNPRFKQKSASKRQSERKLTLTSLSRTLPSAEEITAIIESLERDDDRAAAIVGGELVNSALMTALICRFVEMNAKQKDAMFYGSTSPLHSFSARILMGRAIGVYGPVTEKRLNKIRAVRNAFAHTLVPLNFDHALVASECKEFFAEGILPKTAFARACHKITVELVGEAYRSGGKEMTTHLP